jgi:hypothetical protein
MKSPVARSNNARTNEHIRGEILRRAVGSSDQSTKPQPRNRTKKPGITHKKKVNVPEKERNRPIGFEGFKPMLEGKSGGIEGG